MANNTRTPDYRAMYPEASDDVIKCLKKGYWKMEYAEHDLKEEECEIDNENQTVKFIPSREDSYERLLGTDKQFSISDEPLEEKVVRSVVLEEAVRTLSDEERSIIRELYYLDKTEREVSTLLQIPQSTLNDRKKRTLEKLRKLLENIF